ncbi:hypothetical protein [Streptomyces sp. NPDC059979]|uniref:hypothetical protein n=1 Tax=unclassified Streptomyces TaxID=2593676 RepID=UPI0036669193
MSSAVHLHITNLPPESVQRLHEFITGLPPAAVTADPGPTAAAARAFLARATPDAQALVALAVADGGRALGADFRARRGDRLNGATTSITRTVQALIREGIWPADLPRLLTPTAAGSEGWSKTHAYTLAPRALAPFREALTPQASAAPAPQPIAAALGQLAVLFEQLGHDEDTALERARELLRVHTAELAGLLRTHGHPQAATFLGGTGVDA